MNGCVINGTPIAVDFWKPIKAPQARLFFLTHLHADHTQGLTQSWRLPIYTSPINALLLKHKFKLPGNLVRELEVGESYLIPLDDDGDYTISVTVLEANHVPGAVMFLFQGYFGNILYCGDMRWYPELMEDTVLREVVGSQQLDTLYLDNTFSAPYCVFPSRHQCKQELFSIIDSFPDHIIKISIRDLGREDLLESVARRFQERILVTQTKFEYLQLLNYSDAFTTDPKKARIHAVPMKQVNVRSHKKWNDEHPTISIVLTALFVGWENGPYSSQSKNGMFLVPYSDHSSYPELMEMVSQLAPHQVLPIVQQWSKAGWWLDPEAPDQSVKADVSLYNNFLTFPPPDPVVMPETVVELMQQGHSRLLSHLPRRCGLRRGLSPRRNTVRGVQYSTPDKISPPPTLPFSSSLAHVSSVTIGNRTPSPPLSDMQYQHTFEPSTPSSCSINSKKERKSPTKEMAKCVKQRNNLNGISCLHSPLNKDAPWTQIECPNDISSVNNNIPLTGSVKGNQVTEELKPALTSSITEKSNFHESLSLVGELDQISSNGHKTRLSLIAQTATLIVSNYTRLNSMSVISEGQLSGLVRNAEEVCKAVVDIYSTL